uniref:Uncharacterized protein n=1 Tax=Magallana gigas TaxID=29159 RepID=A0A8W8HW58_MAGGI
MRANNQKPYLPKEGKLISDINKAWDRLEKAEHERELALREELIRQEKLEQASCPIRQKGWHERNLAENTRPSRPDINAYEERVQAVVSVCFELEQEKYHDVERITARKDNVIRLWNYLLELLRARRNETRNVP